VDTGLSEQIIYSSPLVIANLTNNNPNVYYELAFRHTIEKPVILLVPDGQKLPFDVASNRVIFFSLKDRHSIKECHYKIVAQINEIEKSPDNVFNPISLAIELIEARYNYLFSAKEVRKALETISDLKPEDILRDFARVYYLLRNQGIEKRHELLELTSSAEILDTLRKLYMEELLRSADHPLDPIAIAVWGGYLFINSVTSENISFLRDELRRSSEYRKTHSDLVIHNAQYGINRSWDDVTAILQAEVQNDKLELWILNDSFPRDPLPGVPKVLKVSYSFKGQLRQPIERKEGDLLQLP
jgi:hypothetical protein